MGSFKWYQVIYGLVVGSAVIAFFTFCFIEIAGDMCKKIEMPHYKLSQIEINIMLIFILIATIFSYMIAW